MVQMNDARFQSDIEISRPAAARQPITADSVRPYLRAVGLATSLLIVWAGLCSI
jgi:hypothetical protein